MTAAERKFVKFVEERNPTYARDMGADWALAEIYELRRRVLDAEKLAAELQEELDDR